jgi:NAD(P)-dependent dehydrogenase (short-subunit alcohol dehydrogenase family)
MKRLENKVALVTGGASGIGLATVMAFSREGAKVVVSDLAVEGGKEAVETIKARGGEAVFVKADVSRAAEVEGLIGTAVQTYGRLDCAFNNAGIEGTVVPTADYLEKDWDYMIDVNLKGTWLCMKYEILQMLKQGGGAIVNNASVGGLVGVKGFAPYCASKGGVVQLTRTAALEYIEFGVRINVICPGGIRTVLMDRALAASEPGMEAELIGMHPIGRLGTTEECAEPVVWLCSDAASFVVGHAFLVDGGFVAR